MKMKKFLTVMVAALIATLCAFTVACGDDGANEPSGTPLPPALTTMTVEFNENDGNLSFTEVDGATSYQILVAQYQNEPIAYTATASPYKFETFAAGGYRVTVRALKGDEEAGVGSLVLNLTKNIGMPQAPSGVTAAGGVLSWEAEATSVKYVVEAVKNGEVKATKTDLTERTLNISELELGAGVYTLNVYGVDGNGVKGTAGAIRHSVLGNSAFGEEKSEGEWYVADFTRADDRAFAEADGATIVDDGSKVGLAYKDALWADKGVWYTLPEPLKWDEVYQLKVKTRVKSTSGGAYFYIFNDDGESLGIYPQMGWTGYGTETVADACADGECPDGGVHGNQNDKPCECWYLTTFSAENIRRMVVDETMNDSFWYGGEAGYLTNIFFSTAGVIPEVEIEYISYTKRTEATDLALKYDGAELKSEYLSTDKFDWDLLTAVGDYEIDFRLESNGVEVERVKDQRLQAGEYKIIAIARGKYYGRVEACFTVTHSELVVPAGVTDLKYEGGVLSWNAVEGADHYKVTAKYLDGTNAGLKTTVSGVEYTAAIPAGKILLIVSAVSSDGVESRDVAVQYVSLGETRYMQPVAEGSEELIIAEFDTDDYNGFMTTNKADVAADSGVLELHGKGASVIYDLPEAIAAEEIYSIKYKIKELPEGSVANTSNSTSPSIALINAEGEAAYIYTLCGGYYSVTKTLSEGWWTGEVTLDGLRASAGAQWAYYWSKPDCSVTTVRINFEPSCENEIDYIRIVKKIRVSAEDMAIEYDGAAISTYSFNTATDFEWENFALHGGNAADFVLYKDGAAVEKSGRLAAGTYTLKATASGKFLGSSEATFTVVAVEAPASVTNLAWNGTTKTLTWNAVETATDYVIKVTYQSGNALITEAVHGDVTTADGVCSATFTSLLGGYLTFGVQAVNEDGYRSVITTINATYLGEAQFNQSTTTDGEIIIMNADKADYVGFVTSVSDGETLSYAANKGVVSTSALHASRRVEITLPTPLDVENEDYYITFKFAHVIDNVNRFSIFLYDEEGRSAYSFAQVNNVWVRGHSPEGGTYESGSFDGNGMYVTVSSAKIVESTNENHWVNGKAKQITKIAINHTVTNGDAEYFLPITSITYRKVIQLGDNVTISYDGEALNNKSGVVSADVFDWSKLSTGHETTYKLYKNEVAAANEVTMSAAQKLEGGTYVLVATIDEQFVKGGGTATFTVTAVDEPDVPASLAFDEDTKTLSWNAADKATSYKITAKFADGRDAGMVTGGTATSATTSYTFDSVASGYLVFGVAAVSKDNYVSDYATLNKTILGTTSFNAKPTTNSAYTTVFKPTSAEYEGFVYAPNNTVAYVENKGLTIGGGKAHTGDQNTWGENYDSFEIRLPSPLDVANKDYVLNFKFNGIVKDNGTFVRIYLYDASGNVSYSFGRKNGLWPASASNKSGGATEVTADGGNWMNIKISSAQIAASGDACDWTDKKASSITKIGIAYMTEDGTLPVTEITLEPAPLSVTSGSAISGAGRTAILDFDDENFTYDEFGVTDGVLNIKAKKADGMVSNIVLPTAVTVPAHAVIEMRFKAGVVHVLLLDSNGNKVLSGGSGNNVGWIGYHGWNDGGVEYACVDDGETDYKILTVDTAKIVGANVAKVQITFCNAAEGADVFIDWIGIKQKTEDSASTVKYDGAALNGKSGLTTATEFDWTKLSVDGHTATFKLYSGTTEVNMSESAYLTAGTYTVKASYEEKYNYGGGEATFTVTQVTVPDWVTNLAWDGTNKKLSWTKANGAESYVIAVKDVNGNAVTADYGNTVTTDGDTCSVTFTNVGAGYLTFSVKSVSEDNIESQAVATSLQTVLSDNVSFNAKPTTNSAYTTVMKPDHAYYARFVQTGTGVTLEYDESGYVKASGASASNPKESPVWNTLTLDLPMPLNVEGINFVMTVKFYGVTDAASYVEVYLYNENDEEAYVGARRGDIWWNNENVYGGAVSYGGDGASTTTLKLSLAALGTSTDSRKWNENKAETITKIVIKHSSTDGKFSVPEIQLYDASVENKASGISVVSGTASTDPAGTYVLDFADEGSVNYDEYGVSDGILKYTTTTAWSEFATFTLTDAVTLDEGCSIKIRLKGDCYIELKDSDGNDVFTSLSRQGNTLAHYMGGRNDNGVEFTYEASSDSYKICTIAATNINHTNVKQIVVKGARAGQTTYLDYIVAVPATTGE